MNHRSGIASMLVLTIFLCCGFTAPQGCTPQPQPSHTGAEVAGVAIVAAVVIGTVVLIDVHHNHHTLKGCVLSGPSGLELLNPGDAKTYILTGDTHLTLGNLVKLHGTRIKLKVKGASDSPTDPTFAVEHVSKDYGPCKLPPPNTSLASTH